MRKTRLLLAAAVVCSAVRIAAAQDIVELRGADTKYRFADWSHTFGNSAVMDLFYVGVPGSNEFNFGGGYTFKLGKLSLSPLAYAVFGKEGSQRGAKLALLAAWDSHGWRLNSFFAGFIRVSGEVEDYLVLDTMDFTRTFGKRWEAGLSSGLFSTGGDWSPQVGPLVKLNDRLGSWGLSYRFGPQKELRLSRLFAF